MSGHECYHCKQWVEEGEAHDCWTTTEAALMADLSVDLQEAWERLREAAAEFGDQRINASHKSIMFARESCYFFVRPKRTFLELCVFLGRAVETPQPNAAEVTPGCAVEQNGHGRASEQHRIGVEWARATRPRRPDARTTRTDSGPGDRTAPCSVSSVPASAVPVTRTGAG